MNHPARKPQHLFLPVLGPGNKPTGQLIVIELGALHDPILQHLLRLETKIMGQLEDLTAKVAVLEQAAQDSASAASIANGKSDQLIGLVGDLRAELAAAQQAGTAPDLSGLIGRIDAVTSTLNTTTGALAGEAAKEDAALNPTSGTPTTGTDPAPTDPAAA